MKRLGYPIFLVLVSLTCAVLFTTVTATTLASYSKAEKSNVVKDQLNGDGSTVGR